MKDLKWTPEYVEDKLLFCGCLYEGCLQKIADAHNESIDQLVKDRDYFQKLHGMEFKARVRLEETLDKLRDLHFT